MVEQREGEERHRLQRSNDLQSISALFYSPDPIPNPRSDGREGAISQRPPAVLRLPPQVPAGRRTPRLRRLRHLLPPPRCQPPDLLLLCCISPRRLIIKAFSGVALLLLFFELAAYFKGWHFFDLGKKNPLV